MGDFRVCPFSAQSFNQQQRWCGLTSCFWQHPVCSIQERGAQTGKGSSLSQATSPHSLHPLQEHMGHCTSSTPELPGVELEVGEGWLSSGILLPALRFTVPQLPPSSTRPR
ncbi:hypothetical protein JZ751_024328 [Albula glossodonta]|uniref:Uncharacterized protein n=1 Tax=Albula glossodonta TaxID=121402 RepID=A0A8T2NMY3_9TELE|nr:hypothetical protein JZ751_024328 [Albula glossodonta]